MYKNEIEAILDRQAAAAADVAARMEAGRISGMRKVRDSLEALRASEERLDADMAAHDAAMARLRQSR